MPEMFVPEKDHSEDVLLTERVLAELGVDGYERRKNPLTGYVEVLAPEGQGFELGGQFLLTTEQSDIALWGPPVQSTARYEQQRNASMYAGAEEFEDYEPEPTVDSFVGTRLTVAVNNDKMGAINRQGDGWQSHWTNSRRSDSDRPTVTLHVAGPVEAWFEAGGQDFILQKGTGVRSYGLEIFWVPNAILRWRYPVAEGNHLTSTLEVVSHQPAQADLTICQLSEQDQALWKPDSRAWPVSMYQADSDRLTSHRAQIFNMLRGLPAETPLDEDARLQFMRWMRGSHRPMEDDPLQDFWLMEGEQYDPDQLDLNNLAEETLRKTERPPSYAESERLDDERQRLHMWQKREEKLRSTLAVVEGGALVHELVRQNSGDWLAEERAKYLATNPNFF